MLTTKQHAASAATVITLPFNSHGLRLLCQSTKMSNLWRAQMDYFLTAAKITAILRRPLKLTCTFLLVAYCALELSCIDLLHFVFLL